MAQLLVRQIAEDTKTRLKRRARRHGRSLEDEVRHILRDAAKDERAAVDRLGSRITARFKAIGLTSPLPELRGQTPRSVDFDE